MCSIEDNDLKPKRKLGRKRCIRMGKGFIGELINIITLVSVVANLNYQHDTPVKS